MMNRRQAEERAKRLQQILEHIELTIILNFKGGVCKTTILTHLAAYLASHGKKVVLFDCDMQANSSVALLKEVKKPTLTDVLRDQATLDDVIRVARPNLWIVPSDIHLDQGANYIGDDLGKLRRLLHEVLLEGGVLDPETGARVMPDVVLFDTASLTNVTKAALLCAKDIIIPLEYEYFSITGIVSLMEKVGVELTKLNHEIDVRAVIPVKVNEGRKITGKYYQSLRRDPDLGPSLYPPLHIDVKIPEAQERTMTIFEYMPSRRSTQELEVIAQFYTGERDLEAYLRRLDAETAAEESGEKSEVK